MKVSEAVTSWLVRKQITQIFGIIGGGNVALFEAIGSEPRLNLVCTHHEQAAAMAAAYYYRTCNKLACCLVTTGAGSANAITGVLAAWMDSTPLLVISGNESAASMHKPTRVWGVQGYASVEVAANFTKRAERVMSKKLVLLTLDEALDAIFRHRHGPAWVDIPKDIQSADF